MHSANPIGEEEYAENTEYQTTNVYKAAGELNVAALDLFWSEHEGLIKYAKQNLPRTNEYSPFCHWQFSPERMKTHSPAALCRGSEISDIQRNAGRFINFFYLTADTIPL
ncbi:hypothetical protein CIL06_21160 [Pantoea vagans]|nr:hypothetical protein CIL06_21160 [Pantoea vagans]